ncbi:N-acetylneuraminate synthase family protein [Rhodobacter capsulatus]|jgi:N-acetylneuraminate synthase|uniref:Sialic acid synthase n=1 Tax=Rhodobacter capsulatus (strain ATCC BAA-309 / NBRC 16581 / SB1003) TaxID=272942 RepID=D5APW8_RHOCB|nr:N-acetylneuraminate synthase family protein [Rhodobacter capsulatus]ADE86687.1 sialic acid synthase [Rhodobacter capsulatus SB 1003]ETD00258.1 polyhydroxyalkanoate synthesis repressor PhaR [Rhodobacter capsulatus DE442]ETD74598.1 polyhydroxyalkanoate synthesis repressor PhaR [Rhodobacter capsulatus R121]ETD87350.1 polyhydroxyalkanoate synthesis repressor PhaR [Rhodobacter capsulatus B6]ETE52462.1 polyhydroxyalkanoate synthesis repressor PhaR [Rhodobacter capsulatus Y262]
MQIGTRKIGPEHPPLVIAEIGINHGGSLAVAKEMVRLAAASGCECVKHQTHILEDEMTDEAKQIFPPNADVSIWEVMARCALSQDDEIELKRYTESLGMIYLSTPFSRAAAEFLESIGVLAYKIGSGEADNLPLIRHIARLGKPVILSTGMQTIETIRASVEILQAAGVDFALLECTNLYPSPPEIVSLRGVKDLQDAFPGVPVGFSDHSIGPEMALASVALGACILERHYTDTRYRVGPDIINSMDPSELRHLIDRSKEIWIASRNPKERTAAEEPVYRFARASVVADRDLPAGHLITEADIWARRPGSGEIAGYDFDKVVGKRTTRALPRNTQLKWSDLA